jgi:outer membrane protein TolC
MLVAGMLLSACSSQGYLEEADAEVYDIIKEKQERVMGKTSPFSIAKSEDLEEVRKKVDAKFGDGEAEDETDPEEEPQPVEEVDPMEELLAGVNEEHPLEVDLNQALTIAFRTNRGYMDEKEDLYLSALSLTFQRNLWTPIFSGISSAEARRNMQDERFTSSTSEFSVSQLLDAGGEVGLSFANDLLKVYSGGDTETASSLLSFNFLQPLWRGFGSLVAKENLTQAERNVAYSVRTFERFRRSLAVDVASEYYEVLRQMDVVENELNNYENLKLNRERAELMAQAGRMPEFQKDQTEQDELNARNRWILAQERFDRLLDSFKISLGLPTDAPVELDPRDLERLSEAGLDHPEIDLDKAVQFALALRLDYMNSNDRVDDARRRVIVAEDGLAPDLDFSFDYNLGTEAPTKVFKFEPDHPEYGGGLSLDLPLERTSERNSFRQSFIDLERQKRSLSLLEDTIKQSVRESFRQLNQARESYNIQKKSLELAEKRVESTDLLLQAGRADTRDLLESQEALLNAQNALTAAVVAHTIARLDFLLDIEVLMVDEEGLITLLEEKEILIETLEPDDKGSTDHESSGRTAPAEQEG